MRGAAIFVLVCALVAAPALAPSALAQKKGGSAPAEPKPSPIMLVPGERDGVRCNAVVLVDAYQRLGVFGVAGTMGGAMTNASGAGLAATVTYCNTKPRDCEAVAETFRPRLGYQPGEC